MAQFLKPSNLNNVWASGGDRIYPGDTKYATGWQVEIPPRQYFNEIDYKQDQMLAHLNQHGIPVWDSETEYQADQSYVQGSTGTVYRCVLTHTNQNPDLDVSNTYWIIAFASAGDFYTAAESDARYAKVANNGSDYNAATFRTNISVYSKAESYTKSEVNAKTTVASAAQAQAMSSNAVLLTPARLSDAFKGGNQSLSSNGRQVLPGGLILQWGQFNRGTGVTAGDVVFPTPFKTIYQLIITDETGDGPVDAGKTLLRHATLSATGFSWNRYGGSPLSAVVRYLAIGI